MSHTKSTKSPITPRSPFDLEKENKFKFLSIRKELNKGIQIDLNKGINGIEDLFDTKKIITLLLFPDIQFLKKLVLVNKILEILSVIDIPSKRRDKVVNEYLVTFILPKLNEKNVVFIRTVEKASHDLLSIDNACKLLQGDIKFYKGLLSSYLSDDLQKKFVGSEMKDYQRNFKEFRTRFFELQSACHKVVVKQLIEIPEMITRKMNVISTNISRLKSFSIKYFQLPKGKGKDDTSEVNVDCFLKRILKQKLKFEGELTSYTRLRKVWLDQYMKINEEFVKTEDMFNGTNYVNKLIDPNKFLKKKLEIFQNHMRYIATEITTIKALDINNIECSNEEVKGRYVKVMQRIFKVNKWIQSICNSSYLGEVITMGKLFMKVIGVIGKKDEDFIKCIGIEQQIQNEKSLEKKKIKIEKEKDVKAERDIIKSMLKTCSTFYTETDCTVQKLKRIYEGNVRVVRLNSARVIPVLQNTVLSGFKDDLQKTLAKNCVLVNRNLNEDYTIIKTLSPNCHINYNNVYKVTLKEDGLSKYRIVKTMDFSKNQKRTGREIETLAKLDHPHIVKITGVFMYKSNGIPTIPMIGMEMDYFEFDFLHWLKGKEHDVIENEKQYKDLLRLKNKQEKNTVKEVLRKILTGIAYIHEKKVAHRDIKPQNVVLNNENSVKIIDFGESQRLDTLSSIRTRAKIWRYGEPDHGKGIKKKATNKSDMYSYGMMVFECLIGDEGSHLPDHIDSASFFTFRPENDVNNAFRGKFDECEIDFLLKLLKKNPNERPTAKMALAHDFFKFRKEVFQTNVRKENTIAMQHHLGELLRSNTERNSFTMLTMPFVIDRRPILSAIKRLNELQNEMKGLELNETEKINKLDQEIKDHKNELGKTCFDYVDSVSSYFAYRSNNIQSLLSGVFVKFVGENAIDAGGLRREMLTTFCECLKFAKFMNGDGNYVRILEKEGSVYLPSDDLECADLFHNIGVVFFRCFVFRENIPINFGMIFYSFLLQCVPTSHSEWCFFTSRYYRNIHMQFVEKVRNFSDDQMIEFTIMNSDETRGKMIVRNMQEKFFGKNLRRKKNMEGFRRGFMSFMTDIFKTTFFALLNPLEIKDFIVGTTIINPVLLISNITFSNNRTINGHLKKFIKETTNSMRLLMLRAITGCCSISCDEKLKKDGLNHKIVVRIVDKEKNYLFAHTCTYEIDFTKKFEEVSFDDFKNYFVMWLKNIELTVLEE